MRKMTDSETLKRDVKSCHAKGLNNREIAREVGVCPQTVSKVLGEMNLKTNGKPGRKPGAKAQSSEPKADA